MNTAIRLLLFIFVLLLLLGAGVWWYLFGPSSVLAAQSVPSDTIVFLTIPNAAKVTTGYETSKLKQVIDSPNTKPLIDSVINEIGSKNIDLIEAFLPNLSGQSFIAITHFDSDQPAQIGFIAGMKPKPGLDRFDAFVEKLKAAYPGFLSMGATGAGSINGVGYQWLQEPGAPDKICVAKLNGWIVTAWGEATLRDWIERVQKKSAAPSLAENPDYKKSLERVGKDSMALVYVNYHAVMGLLGKQVEKTNPGMADYLAKKTTATGGAALGTSFEQGEIADHFSILMPRQAQIDAGIATAPCAFDTLKFTGPDTRFYWGFGVNWEQAWKNWKDQASSSPQLGLVVSFVQMCVQSAGLDLQRNILDALGPEVSLQAEWSANTTYPEAALFVKINKPDDFKPTIAAIIDAARKAYGNIAQINEFKVDEHSYATLKFVQPSPINPTITEDGDYFGLFLTENQAASIFRRDASVGLLHNDDFMRQIGDKRNGTTQILFIDTPKLLDRGYQTAMPFLSIASMLNKTVAAALKGRNLPDNLAWLAPIGTWSFVTSMDDDGVRGYSVSGIGNQGIFLGVGLGAGAAAAQNMGLLHPPSAAPPPTSPPSPSSPPTSTPADQTNSESATPPPATTNANSSSNAAPPATSPDTTTNPAAAPTPTPTASNSDATPPTPSQPPTTQ